MVLFNIATRRSSDCRREKHKMRLQTSTFCVPVALCAIGLGLFVLTGCERETPPPKQEPPRESPASYMNDPKFRKEVADCRKEMQAIAAKRQPLVDRMQELVDKHGEDEGKLQNVPEWIKLKREVQALNAQYEAAHKRQLATVRDRIKPAATRPADRPAVAPGSKTQKTDVKKN